MEKQNKTKQNKTKQNTHTHTHPHTHTPHTPHTPPHTHTTHTHRNKQQQRQQNPEKNPEKKELNWDIWGPQRQWWHQKLFLGGIYEAKCMGGSQNLLKMTDFFITCFDGGYGGKWRKSFQLGWNAPIVLLYAPSWCHNIQKSQWSICLWRTLNTNTGTFSNSMWSNINFLICCDDWTCFIVSKQIYDRTRVNNSLQPSFFSSHGYIYAKMVVSSSSMILCLSCHVTWIVLHAWLHYGISIKTMHFDHCQ